MEDRRTMTANMERLRANWEKGKEDDADLTSDRMPEAPPTRIISQNCEICGVTFGGRVYYDNVSAKETAFCSPQHVQEYREKRKARLAAAPPPSPAKRPPGRVKA